MKKIRRKCKKKTIQPCGTIIPTKDYFKFKSKNIGVFKKPKLERIEEIEDDIADLKLQNKVNEYKEKYPEHFKEQ